MTKQVKIKLNSSGISKWATSPEIAGIINREAHEVASTLQNSINAVRDEQREHDKSRGNKRNIPNISTRVVADQVDTFKSKRSGKSDERAAADIMFDGLTVMDIMRQTVQRAIHTSYPKSKIYVYRIMGVRPFRRGGGFE